MDVWNGELNATEFGNKCPQTAMGGYNYYNFIRAETVSRAFRFHNK